MPELPEVETIRRGLANSIVEAKSGKILEVKIFEQKSFIGDSSKIVGTSVEEFDRRGKALIVHLANGYSMIIHLRMTGQLIFRAEDATKDFAGGHPNENFVDALPNKQTRVMIIFEKGTLFFNDQRKFGFIKVIESQDVEKDSFIKKLAHEPWDMKPAEFREALLRHKKAPIKSVILDQTVIAGLGNIYADEALYYAKVHPSRKVESLTDKEMKDLLEGARIVMERSLDSGGSTMRNYVKSDGTRGDYLELFAKVFNRQGKPCERCGETILKTKVGGRGTHFCPKCQKI